MRDIQLILLFMAILCLSACPAGNEQDVADNPTGSAETEEPAGDSDNQAVGDSTTGHNPDMDKSPESGLPFELPAISRPDPATQQATIAAIGNFRGFQKPCACTPEQEGGLARLGHLMHSLQASESFAVSSQSELPDGEEVAAARVFPPDDLAVQPLWLIELGNFSWTSLHFPGLRARTHLQVLAAIGGRAAIPGTHELNLDYGDAVAALAQSPVPLVSCNLSVDMDGISIAPYLQLAENWYLIGLTSATDMEGLTARQQDWWQLHDPEPAVLLAMKDLPPDCNIVVAGAGLEHELATKLLADGRVSCCIGVAGNYHRRNPAEPAMFRDPLPKATLIDLISMDADEGAVTSWSESLDEEFRDDARVMALIKHEAQLSRERLRERRAARAAAAGAGENPEFGMSDRFLPAEQRKFSYENDPSYVGGESCLHCHREISSKWRATRHASALHSLKSEGQADMLDCLSCHSTGLLEPGGYDPLEPIQEMSAVGCESCHGPGSHHVHAMENPVGKPEGSLISRETIDGCVRCHDPYNSPHFEFDSYWEKIRH